MEKIQIRDKHPESYFREVFGLKILECSVADPGWIRDVYPGSRIQIFHSGFWILGQKDS
jgi:hypothetical protein